MEVCLPAKCCSDRSYNPDGEGSYDVCSEYVTCSILPLTDPNAEVSLAPISLKSRCSRSNMTEIGETRDVCYDA